MTTDPTTTETNPPAPPVPARKPLTTRRRLGQLMAALVAIWVIGVSFGTQVGTWVSAVFDASGLLSDPVRATWLQAALLALPILPLSLVWRAPRIRALFRTWLWAIGYLICIAATRLLPPVESQLLLLLQLAVTVIYLWVAQRYSDRPPPATAPTLGNARLIALAVGLVLALPWVAAGALGSWLDTLLAALLALAWGALGWTLLNIAWLPTLRVETHGPRRDRLVSGLAAGVLLLILASGLSFNGAQLWLMVALPATAWAALASGAPGLVWGIAAAAPLLLIDSDAATLLASDGLLADYAMAAGWTVLLGWALGLLGSLSRATWHRLIARPVALGLALAALGLAVALYLTAGSRGFYGDRLFVILTPQADVSGAAQLQDLATRRQAVHTTLVAHARATQADLAAALDRLGIGYTPYYLVNALEVDGGLLLRLWLETRPDVDRVLISPELRPETLELATGGETRSAPDEPPWNLTLIGADRVWADFGARGQGVIIGQSDSGVEADHPALAGRYLGRTTGSDYHWFDPWYGAPAPVDYNGHGTHTLGTILGETVGVAPAAEWIACANLVRNLGSPAKYLACMQFMLAPFPLGGDPFADGDPSRGANVLNNSWGCPAAFEGCDALVFAPAVRALRTAGIFVVASAGNEGPHCATVADPIATYDEVTTVGAVDRRGNLAPFSSAGPVTVDGSGRTKPDVAAPGVDILSAFPGHSYLVNSGTSMAGPHVAGVVALMWSANPALVGDVTATETLLLEAARPFTGTLAPPVSEEQQAVMQETLGTDNPLDQWLTPARDPSACLFQTDLDTLPNNIAGYGVVDAYRAVELARNAGQ